MSKPCIKCGSTDRSPRGDCKSCKKAYRATYHTANAEKIKAAQAIYRGAHREIAKAKTAVWRAANPAWAAANRVVWARANPEKVKATIVVWTKANSRRGKAKMAAWYVANAARAKATSAAWSAENPEAGRIKTQNRRARKCTNGGVLSKGLATKLFKLQQGKCPCCAQPLDAYYHLDHILPLVLGGTNTDDNVQLLRARCNLQKNAKHPVDFMQERGFLL